VVFLGVLCRFYVDLFFLAGKKNNKLSAV